MLFSHSVMFDSLQPYGLQHARHPCPSPSPELTQTHVHWVSDAIQPSCPLSSPSPPAFNFSQHQGFFQWVSSLHQVAKVLELYPQHQSLQWIFRTDFHEDWLVWSCSPVDSGESSPAPQFKSINSSVLGLLYGPALTSIHDYWKNNSFDYTDFCWQNVIFAFQHALWICRRFPSKEQASFNFMAAVTVRIDFGAQENCHCFIFSLFAVKWWDWMPWT